MGGIAESDLSTRAHKKDYEYSKENKHKRLTNVLRNLEKFEGFGEWENINWFVVGNRLHLLNDIIIDLNGTRMPLSYPYIIEGCGTRIKHCILGVEYDNREIAKLYIGIPGIYKSQCKPCFNFKGFSAYKKTQDNKMGYWIMCIDLRRGRLCKA